MCSFVVFLGIPGSGKGTQCALLKNRLGALCLSPGEIIRKTLSNNDEKSNDLVLCMKRGELLSDDFIMNLVENNLKSVILKQETGNEMALIFDGIPRTIEQAVLLDGSLDRIFNKKVDLVILLEVKKRVVLKRLKNRVVCLSCGAPSRLYTNKKFVCESCNSNSFKRREDDEESVIRRRLVNDKKNIDKIYSFYRKNGVESVKINADSNQESVFRRIKGLMSDFL